MTFSYFGLYLWTLLDKINAACCFLFVSFLLITFATVVFSYLEDEEKIRMYWKKTLFAAGIFGFLCILIPTKEEVAFIYITPKITNSNFVQEQIPSDAKELYENFKLYIKKQVEKK